MLDESIAGPQIRAGGPPAIDLSKINFEALIESYNNGSRNIEQLFEELLKLSNSLDEEQERHVRESLSGEELVIFDILTRPAPELTTAERDEVKKVAKALLERLKSLLVLKWRQKAAARSTMKLAIEDALDGLPDACDRPPYAQKCNALFEHVYGSYPERGEGSTHNEGYGVKAFADLLCDINHLTG